MDEIERKNFVYREMSALYEELDNTINQLVVLRPFFKNVLDVANGAETFYKFNEISQKDFD